MKMDLLTPESYDTKTLRENAQGLPQRSEGTQTQRKLSLESDAFAAQNPAKQDSYSHIFPVFSVIYRKS